MCGRYTQTHSQKEVIERFEVEYIAHPFGPRYNIAPSQMAPVIVSKDDEVILKEMRWGLIPSWAKDSGIGNKMINARTETLSEKPSFKRLLVGHRCLIPADGFYEWAARDGRKRPYRILMKNQSLFAFAGLWNTWKAPDGKPIESFTIITTAPNSLTEKIHNRMPVILPREDEARWLDPEFTEMSQLLTAYPANEMEAYPISNLVNNPRNDVKECLSPC